MALLFKILEMVIKLGILFSIIAFERVVGFPVLFLTIAISYMLLAKTFSKYVYYIFAAFFLAIFYQLSFVLTLLVLASMYLGFSLGAKSIESNLKRFMGLLIISVLIIAYASNVIVSLWIVVQLIVSLLASALFLMKYLFTKYGFIGKRLTRS